MSPAPGLPLILVTGASGYVGGRLVRVLLSEGFRVRCLARRPEELRGRMPAGVELVAADVSRPDTLPAALAGVHAAFYLVQSLGSTKDVARRDETAARNFALAAYGAGVSRIVYLGALADESRKLGPHLQGRLAAGRVLRESGVTTVELRCAPILGSGSALFEMARSLAEKQPVLGLPPWARERVQPIAIGDVMGMLVRALRLPLSGSTIFELGGSEVVTFGAIHREIGRQLEHARVTLPVPFGGARISSLNLGASTPLPPRVARKIVETVGSGAVVKDASARRTLGPRPKNLTETIAAALANEGREFPETRWCLSVAAFGEPRDWSRTRLGDRLTDVRAEELPVPADTAYSTLRRLGGNTGWHSLDWLWDLRGAMDLALGGMGMRRGRRDPENLVVGDVVDCWRVEAIEPGRKLVLRSEWKVPGRAWLEWRVERKGDEASRLKQTATFEPLGIAGLVYWYALWPVHQVVFQGLLEGIGVAARESWRRRKEAMKRGAGATEVEEASRTGNRRKRPDPERR